MFFRVHVVHASGLSIRNALYLPSSASDLCHPMRPPSLSGNSEDRCRRRARWRVGRWCRWRCRRMTRTRHRDAPHWRYVAKTQMHTDTYRQRHTYTPHTCVYTPKGQRIDTIERATSNSPQPLETHYVCRSSVPVLCVVCADDDPDEWHRGGYPLRPPLQTCMVRNFALLLPPPPPSPPPP